jgi:hypothetical protein
MKRYGPSRRRAQSASAALRIFVRHPKKTFATISPQQRTSPLRPAHYIRMSNPAAVLFAAIVALLMTLAGMG